MKYTLDYIQKEGLILFSTISGSRAYGTHTPESDTDIRGVFIQPLDDILKYGYIEQISDEKNDIIYYELSRFIKLAIDNNPNIIELLNMPSDCIIFKHPLYEKYIESNKNKFLSKKTKFTFGEYANSQIKKATGYNKKINWDKNKIIRKDVLDFCYVIDEINSIPFKDWILEFEKNIGFEINQKFFGLSKINHTRGIYRLYYLGSGDYGIIKDNIISNDIQLTSIPKDIDPVGILFFNKDNYSIHCKDYREYEHWIKNRNQNRYNMNLKHGKNYDSKNIMHVYRLILMLNELSMGVIKVRRDPNEIEKLMKIRKGEYDYDKIMDECFELIDKAFKMYEISTLPDSADFEFLMDTKLQIRKEFYKI